MAVVGGAKAHTQAFFVDWQSHREVADRAKSRREQLGTLVTRDFQDDPTADTLDASDPHGIWRADEAGRRAATGPSLGHTAHVVPQCAGGQGCRSTAAVEGQTFAEGFLLYEHEGQLELDGKFEWFEAWVAVVGGAKGHTQAFFVEWRTHRQIADQAKSRREQFWALVTHNFQNDPAADTLDAGYPHGIWRADWKPGDVQQLARRLTAAAR